MISIVSVNLPKDNDRTLCYIYLNQFLLIAPWVHITMNFILGLLRTAKGFFFWWCWTGFQKWLGLVLVLRQLIHFMWLMFSLHKIFNCVEFTSLSYYIVMWDLWGIFGDCCRRNWLRKQTTTVTHRRIDGQMRILIRVCRIYKEPCWWSLGYMGCCSSTCKFCLIQLSVEQSRRHYSR